MDLHEKVELAMWSLRRTIERARYINLESATLRVSTQRRLTEMRNFLDAFAKGKTLEQKAAPKESEPPDSD